MVYLLHDYNKSKRNAKYSLSGFQKKNKKTKPRYIAITRLSIFIYVTLKLFSI